MVNSVIIDEAIKCGPTLTDGGDRGEITGQRLWLEGFIHVI